MFLAVTQYIKLTNKWREANLQSLVRVAPFDRRPVDVSFMLEGVAL